MIFKVRRYAPDYAGLTGKDLTPGEAIEASGQGEPSSAP